MRGDWRAHLEDVALLALWLLEHGEKKPNQRYVAQVQGTTITLECQKVEYGDDNVQLSLAGWPTNTGGTDWKAALGLAAPAHLVTKPGIMDGRGGDDFVYDGQVLMPDYFGSIDRLDKLRGRKKTSPGSDQMNPMYVAYWFLRYGVITGDDKLSTPGAVDEIFTGKLAVRPYSYLNDPTGRFVSDFVAAKMMWS